MRVSYIVFWIISIFFLFVATVYVVWGILAEGKVEWAGTVALGLVGIFAALVAFYLQRVHGAQGGALPEDRVDSNIDDGDAELGFFSPWSWWPVLLAASAGLFFVGLAVGFWMCYIAGGLAAICLVGWVYEYYRGNFAR